MKVEVPDFLRLVEQAGTLGFWDLECTGLRGDYSSVLCGSIKHFDGKTETFAVEKPGNDRAVVKAIRDYLGTLDCWVGYFSKGFDKGMLNARLLKWGLDPLPSKPHIDLYYSLKSSVLVSRRSQAHYLGWLKTPEEKMSVSADDWVEVIANPKKIMPTMIKRCESDVAGLEALYRKTKHLLKDISR